MTDEPSAVCEVNDTDGSILECRDGMNEAYADLYEVIRWWLEGVLHIIICTVGIVANSITIRVLFSKDMRNMFNITLAFLAMCELIYILCDITESIRMVHYDSDSCIHLDLYQTVHLHLFPHVLRPLRYMSMVSSIYMTVVLAMERYAAVSKPLSSFLAYSEDQAKWKSVLVYIIPVFVFSICFSLPKFFEFETNTTDFLCHDGMRIEELGEKTSYKSLLMAQKGIFYTQTNYYYYNDSVYT